MLKLNTQLAQDADNIASSISELGKYIGTITRAEKLVSKQKGTQGLGLSFKADNGQSADYLDLYHTKGDGTQLSAAKTVNAILCCARVKQAEDGVIDVEKWDKAAGQRRKMRVNGYPALMGKRIGLLLTQIMETGTDGKDRTKLEIFGVFDPETELTASEILQRKTTPERLSSMLDAMIKRGVQDKRKKPAHRSASAGQDRFDDIPIGDVPADASMDDDIPF